MSMAEKLKQAIQENRSKATGKDTRLADFDALLKREMPKILELGDDHLAYEHFSPDKRLDPMQAIGQPFFAEAEGSYAVGIRIRLDGTAINSYIRVSFPDADNIDFGLIGSGNRWTLKKGKKAGNADAVAAFAKELFDRSLGALKDKEVQTSASEGAFIEVNEYDPPGAWERESMPPKFE